jgi:hypothetical protein
MPISYINPIYNNNISTETESLNVTGVTILGDNSDDTIIINAKTISIPNDININNNNLFIKNTTSRVGLNTEDPSQLLDVNGNMVVSGFLGIGTNNPSYKFHIVNTVSQGQNASFGIEDTGLLAYYPNMTASLLNPAVALADKGLIVTNGTVNTGSLFIGTWSSNGVGLKLNSTQVLLYGNIILGTNTDTTTINGNLIINASTLTTPNNLNIDSNLIFIDATNNRVGINNATPTVPIDIQSDGSAFGINIRGRASDNIGLLRFLNNSGVMRHSIGSWSDDSLMFLNSSSSSTFAIAQNGQLSAVIPGGATLYPGYLCRAWINFNGTSAADVTGTYSQSGTAVTVTITNHGLLQGHSIYSDITSGAGVDGIYTVASVTNSNVFTYTAGTSLTTSGNITLYRRAIRANGNISNVTYNNVAGDYTINFTNAMPDVNYCTIPAAGGTSAGFLIREGSESIKTVNAVRIYTATQSGGTTTSANLAQVNVTIFR